jgi:hypothetical protein
MDKLEQIQKILDGNVGNVSDGYHSFNELYHHRTILFSVICNSNKEKCWKSLKHDDGSMFEGYFVVGIYTRGGQFTYHYQMCDWHLFDVKELEFAPEYDGHIPDDIHRLLNI